MLTAQIFVPVKDSSLEKLFSVEEKNFPNERASYVCRKTGGGLEFNVKANDSVALRSVLNTITKIITVHEKTERLLKDG